MTKKQKTRGPNAEQKPPEGPDMPPDTDEKSTSGEQLDLIDVAPENVKEIVKIAKRYKKAQTERIVALQREVEEKNRLLTAVKQSNPQQLGGGKVKFKADGMVITITPRDELVRVKEDGEPDTESDD